MPDFTPDIDRVRSEAGAMVERFHLPGLGVALLAGGELVHAEGLGYADIAAGQRYSMGSRHRIGSVTKTMIGLCVMALADEGRLSLQDRVVDLLPDITFHGHADSLTIWHLLTHTGGIGEAPNPEDLRKPFDKLFYETDPAVPLAELYTDGITIEVPPGTKWAYANHGFALLGEIVSRIEEEPLAAVVARRVFEPLAMRSSDLLDEPHPGLAHGYTQAQTQEARALIDFMGIQLESDEPIDGYNMPGKFVKVWGNGGAGAVQSTLTDMAVYASALLRGSDGVVRPETFAEMTSDQFRPDTRLPGWGLSFGVHERGGHRGFGHGGAVFGGWNSYLGVYPDLDAAIVIHSNIMSDDFADVVAPAIAGAFLGIDQAASSAAVVDQGILDSAAGVYELPDASPLTNFRPRFNPGRLQLLRDGDILRLYSRRGPWKEGCRLLPDPSDPELFAVDVAGRARVPFILARDSSGKVQSVRFPTQVEMFRNPDLDPWI